MSGFQSPNYTQVPNDLFDQYLPEMGYAELKVVVFVCRHTFGFHRDRKRMSIRALARGTGLTSRNAIEGAAKAIARGLLFKIQDGGVSVWGVIVGDTPVVAGDTVTLPSVVAGDTPSKKEKSLLKKDSKKSGANAPARPVGKPSLAVEAFREVRRRYPRKENWPEIDGAVGGSPTDIDFWKQVLVAYTGLGWSPTAVSIPVDYFRKHEIPTVRRSKHGTQAHQPNQLTLSEGEDSGERFDSPF